MLNPGSIYWGRSIKDTALNVNRTKGIKISYQYIKQDAYHVQNWLVTDLQGSLMRRISL